jgi:hypothetical protein
MSLLPPGAKGTMSLIGFVGYSAAITVDADTKKTTKRTSNILTLCDNFEADIVSSSFMYHPASSTIKFLIRAFSVNSVMPAGTPSLFMRYL